MIAHFDIDAFYASVAVRDDPSLRGKPLAIAWRGRRSVVLTASYEARPFGVRSAMPLYKALSACADLVVVPPDMAKYKAVSREVFTIFGQRGHPVEGLSMDEAFIDFGPMDLKPARELAQTIRDEVYAATLLTVSGGVATGKMIAKIASDFLQAERVDGDRAGRRSRLSSTDAGRPVVGDRPENATALAEPRRRDDRPSRCARRRRAARTLRILG